MVEDGYLTRPRVFIYTRIRIRDEVIVALGDKDRCVDGLVLNNATSKRRVATARICEIGWS